MIGRDELISFRKMWTWLSAHPTHDQDYYMDHVVQLKEKWLNGCPLSTSVNPADCRGCELLWASKNGSLCTDPDAPVYKWRDTSSQQPDNRTYYAIKVAVLAMKLMHSLERQAKTCILRRAPA